MKKNEENKRLSKNLPLTKEFMTKKVSDGVYGYMLSQTVGYNKQTVLFLDSLDKKDMAKKLKTTVRTIDRQIKTLKATELIKESVIKGKKALIFTKTRFFQSVELDTLNYLLDIFNPNVIKVYAYLLDKFQWKYREGKRYEFDIKELIQEVYGLDSTTNQRDYKSLNNILNCLIREGLLEIEIEYIQLFGQENMTRRLIITNVLTRQPKLLTTVKKVVELENKQQVIVEITKEATNLDISSFIGNSVF